MAKIHVIPRPQIYKDNTLVIDHISYLLREDQLSIYQDHLHAQGMDQLPLPHLTLAYSPNAIERFPVRGVEGEVIYEAFEKTMIVIERDTGIFGHFDDPVKGRSLILSLSGHPQILSNFTYFHEKRGACWPFGTYHPFLILESPTTITETQMKRLKLFPFDLVFSKVRYRRFAQLASLIP